MREYDMSLPPSHKLEGLGLQTRNAGGMVIGQSAARSPKMRFIAFLWPVFYISVFTVGRVEQWTQPIIWGGGGFVALLTVWSRGYRLRGTPREAFLLAAFLCWALLGLAQVVDFDEYRSYFKLVVEMLGMVALLGTVIRKSGYVNALWWAFLAVAIYNTAVIFVGGPLQIGGVSGHVVRARGITDNPNGLAFLCFMGILGALALAGEKPSLTVKVVAAAGAFVSLCGILAAGSRGAYFVLVLALLLWPLLCIESRARSKLVPIVATVVAGVALYCMIGWIQVETNLGERTTRLFAGQDSSGETRLDLILEGLKLTRKQPFTGVGLGQFGIASRMDMYAHNEWVELLSTTGIPGFLLFMSVYWSAWRRLSKAIRKARDPILRYRINFARMTLIILVTAGAVFRPNFFSVDTMFLLAMIVGVSWWAKDQTLVETATRTRFTRPMPRRSLAWALKSVRRQSPPVTVLPESYS